MKSYHLAIGNKHCYYVISLFNRLSQKLLPVEISFIL